MRVQENLEWVLFALFLKLIVLVNWLASAWTLWRLYAAGYDDTAQFFARESARRWLSARRSASGAPALPAPSELPIPPARRDRTLLRLIALGWLQLILLTLLFPFVPPYLAVRALLRAPSPLELRRAREAAEPPEVAAAGLSPPLSEPTRSADPRDLSFVMLALRRAFVMMLMLVVWPLCALLICLRIMWPVESEVESGGFFAMLPPAQPTAGTAPPLSLDERGKHSMPSAPPNRSISSLAPSSPRRKNSKKAMKPCRRLPKPATSSSVIALPVPLKI